MVSAAAPAAVISPAEHAGISRESCECLLHNWRNFFCLIHAVLIEHMLWSKLKLKFDVEVIIRGLFLSHIVIRKAAVKLLYLWQFKTQRFDIEKQSQILSS